MPYNYQITATKQNETMRTDTMKENNTEDAINQTLPQGAVMRCADCIFWKRKIEKTYKCLDKSHKMYGHIMKNWHWSDVPYTEIEETINNYGVCQSHTEQICKSLTEAMLSDDGRDTEYIYTNENFGCVLFRHIE